MWWRNPAAALLPFVVAACSFQPLYGQRDTGGAPVAALQAVQVATIPDRSGQMLRNHLELLFNPRGVSTDDRYTLSVHLTRSQTDSLTRKDETASRINQTVTADFVLASLPDKRVLKRGKSRAVDSFDVVESDYATLSAERDALDGSLRQIAQDIQMQLALYFQRQGDVPSAAPVVSR